VDSPRRMGGWGGVVVFRLRYYCFLLLLVVSIVRICIWCSAQTMARVFGVLGEKSSLRDTPVLGGMGLWVLHVIYGICDE
jgi:hypothetical protein